MEADFVMDAAAERRLEEYFAAIGQVLNNKRRRASYAMYAMAILGDGERKSAEPIAARACGDPALANAYHQRLLEFLGASTWSDHHVRRLAARYAIEAMVAREPMRTWIIDDTGFLKQGNHSVGVQRQYTGTAGKIANCQVGVSLSVATKTEHVPIDFELCLPQTWAEDPARRRKARIPDEVVFETKPQLALNMVRWAVEDGLPKGVLLADSAYGDSGPFREGVRGLGLDYAVGLHGPTKVWRLDTLPRRRGEPISVAQLALSLGRSRFRRVTWREGSKQPLWSRFACQRVVPTHDDGWDPAVREDVWRVIDLTEAPIPGISHQHQRRCAPIRSPSTGTRDRLRPETVIAFLRIARSASAEYVHEEDCYGRHAIGAANAEPKQYGPPARYSQPTHGCHGYRHCTERSRDHERHPLGVAEKRIAEPDGDGAVPQQAVPDDQDQCRHQYPE